MKTLECELCGTIIKPGDEGLKYNDVYFCSQACLNQHVDWDTYPIEPIDFEQDGEDVDEEDDNDEDEILND